MTTQITDTIILNGEVSKLHSESPFAAYCRRINWKPSFIWMGTNNFRGYVARWEVFGERLFLTGLYGRDWVLPPHLVGKLPDPALFRQPNGMKCLQLPDIFPDQSPLVFADWVTQRLDVPTGRALVHFYGAFGTWHETYRTLDVVEGRISAIRDWNGPDWAKHVGYVWPPEPKQTADDEAEADDRDFGLPNQLSGEDDCPDWYRYELAQIDALREPCGLRPIE
jgi:hypothetical protein